MNKFTEEDLKKIDYQLKSTELAKEVLFHRKYGKALNNTNITNKTKECEDKQYEKFLNKD